jgi:hypothetical protein
MALKYWYVASNGSAAWSVAGNWYNGSGGTGGVAGVPTTADDAIVDSASGSGTLTIGGTSTCNSLNTLTFTGTLAGTQALNIVTSSIASNSGFALQLGGNHTYSGTITFTTTINYTTTFLYINCNGIFHKGNMTFNSLIGGWFGNDPIRLTGTLLLTTGYVLSVDLYSGTISTSNSNVRTFQVDNLYLSGVGTLISAATQTNLSWNVAIAIYLTNTTATSKTISFSSNVYSPNLYIQGSGASNTTIAVAATSGIYPNIYVSKTDGILFFNTTYLTNLTFVEGTTVTWGSTSNIFIYGNVTMCNSVINAATTNPLTFAGAGTSQTFTTFNKTFTGVLNVNDGGSFSSTLNVIGDYISTSISAYGINITSTQLVQFNGSVTLYTSGITVNSAGGTPQVDFNSINQAEVMVITNELGTVNLGSSTFSGSITVNTGTLTIIGNSTVNMSAFISSSNSNFRIINLGTNTVINLTNTTGTIWNTSSGISAGVLTFNPGTSTVNITDTTGGTVNFLGGGITLYDLNIRRGVMGTNNPITTFTGNQTYRNFKDLTTLQSGFVHTIQFGSNSDTIIYDTFQVGNSVNLTQLISVATAFKLYKINPGLVICPNVFIQNSNAASPPNTWYAINGSADGGNVTGWIFNNIPRRLASLGVG